MKEISKNRQVLYDESTRIPGLVLFGHNINSKAELPLKLHTHKDCIEIVILVKGQESYFIEDQKYDLSGGDVFISLFNQPHQSGGPYQGVSEFYWFQIDLTQYDKFLGLSERYASNLISSLLSIEKHVFRVDNECLSLVKKSFRSALNNDNEIYIISLFLNMLTHLLNNYELSTNKNTCVFADRVLEYIDKNIEEDISLYDICEYVGVSLSTLKHKFKKEVGKTPRDYINFKKVSLARKLLSSGKNVSETALSLGYSSSDYFSVVFKRYTAMTPMEYIKSTAKVK